MNTKITIIALAILVAMGSVGLAYGLYYKPLYVEGMVDTGDIDAQIIRWFSDDPPGQRDPFPWIWGSVPTFPLKDVGTTICTIDAIDPQIAYIDILNGYPYYSVHCNIFVENTGTVPWILEAYRVNDVVMQQGIWYYFDIDGVDCPDIAIMIHIPKGTQTEPGGYIDSSLDIMVLQTASKNMLDAHFTLEILLVQWNEYPSNLWS